MTVILNHKYENDKLYFEVESEGEKKWVKGKDLSDKSIIQQYWKDLDKKTKENAYSNWGISQVTIPPPTKIMEIINIDGFPHALCKFDTFDTPVYVPVRFLRNSYPSILINFFEDSIMENPEKYG